MAKATKKPQSVAAIEDAKERKKALEKAQRKSKSDRTE